MTLSKDWREFLELLNSRGVEYVIAGTDSLAVIRNTRQLAGRRI
jgi:hypothetical protein